jgi:hypothetical protein
MKKYEYTHKGITYEIIDGDKREEYILRDFMYCESIGDWNTIKNRIIGGTMHGWLKEIEEEQNFW